MMGMMTLVRVLSPEKYDEIMAMIPEGSRQPNAPAAKERSIAFSGKVQAVSESTGRLTVNHGAIEGWMGAMTMAYPVDKPESLKGIKAGDQISATVYEGDFTLHNVQIAPSGNR